MSDSIKNEKALKAFNMELQCSYASLPKTFYAPACATSLIKPEIFAFNEALGESLGLDEASAITLLNTCSSHHAPPKNEQCIAMAYAGHQFGHFVPSLGDGRALLLGEVINKKGIRLDLQLKGAGRTPFSRSGDGRAVLGPVMREYLIAEFMHHLGIPTTRALLAFTTGETVMREGPKVGAALIRTGQSHIRVGTFQYFAARKAFNDLKTLADYAIKRHYPECQQEKSPYIALLKAITDRQAHLIASWMAVGFIHGVMNTDNMQIAGETLDYGPCALLDDYDPAQVLSAIDSFGRYAYQNQPVIAHWNLSRLGSSLLPLIGETTDGLEQIESVVDGFFPEFHAAYARKMASKLGLKQHDTNDTHLIKEFLEGLHETRADFHMSFRELKNCVNPSGKTFNVPAIHSNWIKKWHQRLTLENVSDDQIIKRLTENNPVYVPRNHLIERAIQAAENDNNFHLFNRMLELSKTPFTEQVNADEFTIPPEKHEKVHQTFCGT